MSLKANIINTDTEHEAQVDYTAGEKQALVVATRPLKTFLNKTEFFTNPTFGFNMNIAAGFSIPAEVVYQENVEWTTSAISGVWDFSSVTQSHAGAVSVDGTLTSNNDTAQFLRSGTFDLSNSDAITGWIYVTVWPDAGTKEVNLQGYLSGTASIVGTSVNIGDYINTADLGVWQAFTIPLSDMSLDSSVIDALRVFVVASGPGADPDFFLDNIQIEENQGALGGGGSEGDSGSVIYTVQPDRGTWWHMTEIKISVVAVETNILLNGTLPWMEYDTFMGVSLIQGITYQRLQGDEIKFSAVLHNLIDWFQFPNTRIQAHGGDDTTSLLTFSLAFAEPPILKSELRDELRIILADDLSGLSHFRIIAEGKEEIRF